MNALAIVERQDEEYDRRAMVGELETWGAWIEKHAEFEGYPSINILMAYTGGAGGSKPEHRILCLDMPIGVFATHQRIIRLPEAEREAIWIRHVTVLKENGQIWSSAERCLIAGVSEVSLRKRLSRAYQRLMGVLPD